MVGHDSALSGVSSVVAGGTTVDREIRDALVAGAKQGAHMARGRHREEELGEASAAWVAGEARRRTRGRRRGVFGKWHTTIAWWRQAMTGSDPGAEVA